MTICNKTAQGKACVLELYHDGFHVDEAGFKFLNEQYPDFLGNGPNGYPMNNLDFDAAAKKVLDARKVDAEQAKSFLQRLAKSFRNKD